jgi:hypothetical protein
MAQYIVEGKIGSGKTYWCVNFITRKYFEYDDVVQEWIPRRNILLISNIDGLKLDHRDLDVDIQSKGTISDLFACVRDKDGKWTSPYIEGLRSQYGCRNIVLVIDEAQSPDKFHRKYYNENVFILFQLSRHFGLDIFLITQDVDSIAKEIKVLSEYYIHAVDRSSAGHLSFTYKKILNGECVYKFKLHHNKTVFAAYKSFNFDEGEKPKPIYVRYAVYMVLGVLLCCVSIYGFYKSFVLKAIPKQSSVSQPAFSPASGFSSSSGTGKLGKNTFVWKEMKDNKVSFNPSSSSRRFPRGFNPSSSPPDSEVLPGSEKVAGSMIVNGCVLKGKTEFEGHSFETLDCEGSIVRKRDGVIISEKTKRLASSSSPLHSAVSLPDTFSDLQSSKPDFRRGM